MTAKVKITPKNIAGADITLGNALTYTGTAQTQSITSVVIGGLDATYDVNGNTGTNADHYELTVTGTGNFVGTAKKAWSIAQKEIIIEWCEDNYTYNGAEQAVTATYQDVAGSPVSLAVATTGVFRDYAESGYEFTVSFANGETNYRLPALHNIET